VIEAAEIFRILIPRTDEDPYAVDALEEGTACTGSHFPLLGALDIGAKRIIGTFASTSRLLARSDRTVD
jgi:hypothetical protein